MGAKWDRMDALSEATHGKKYNRDNPILKTTSPSVLENYLFDNWSVIREQLEKEEVSEYKYNIMENELLKIKMELM